MTDTQWDAVTLWTQEYLLSTTDPYTALKQAAIDPDLIASLSLTPVSAQNAHTLVKASRKDIQRQIQLLNGLLAEAAFSSRPEKLDAERFLELLKEDERAHLSQDIFRTSVLKNGAEVFIDRQDLRETLRGFVDDPHRLVLVVDGEPDSGRSYTYSLIRHIGQHRGFRPTRVMLSPTSTATKVVRRLADFVSDPRAGIVLPRQPGRDDPAAALEEDVTWVVERATKAEDNFWLVLDDCDKLDPGSDVWDLINRLALDIYNSAGERSPRLVLLGFSQTMRQLPFEVRGNVCRDTARVVAADDLRAFFDQYFRENPPPGVSPEARDETVAGLVEVAVEEVLSAARPDDTAHPAAGAAAGTGAAANGDGESYMRRICTAAEGAIRVYRSL
ncbi:hypothetical protein [Streptomyces sp. NPDC047928]|uniref:hypothetical protein n=1 Tax=unclassified Streptomyces TaxID=2593676 RepID=UPI0037104C19